jgi:hypothetical protein
MPENATSDAEIGRPRSILEQFIRDWDEARSIIEKHRTSLSPIRRLPPELLGHICIHCIPVDLYQSKVLAAPRMCTVHGDLLYFVLQSFGPRYRLDITEQLSGPMRGLLSSGSKGPESVRYHFRCPAEGTVTVEVSPLDLCC